VRSTPPNKTAGEVGQVVDTCVEDCDGDTRAIVACGRELVGMCLLQERVRRSVRAARVAALGGDGGVGGDEQAGGTLQSGDAGGRHRRLDAVDDVILGEHGSADALHLRSGVQQTGRGDD
jgi:hypothetical protein